MAGDGDKELTGSNEDHNSLARDGVTDSIAGALLTINNRERIHPTDMSLQTNGVQLRSSELTPLPNGAAPPSGDQQSVNWESTSSRHDVHARCTKLTDQFN